MLVGCRKGTPSEGTDAATDAAPADASIATRSSAAPWEPPPPPPPVRPDLVKLGHLVCAIGLEDDTTKCWGTNSGGLLGANALYRKNATEVPLLRNARASSGDCLAHGDELACIDANNELKTIKNVAANVTQTVWGETMCVLRDGQPLCGGDNSSGLLGDGTSMNRSKPGPVKNLSFAYELRGGDHIVYARNFANNVVFWGRDDFSSDKVTIYNEPAGFVALGEAVSLRGISETGEGNCVLRKNGDVACWGPGRAPAAFSLGSPAVDVASSIATSCAVTESGKVGCWGSLTKPSPKPRPLTFMSGLDGATRIIASDDGFCALVGPNHQARCWGRDGVVTTVPNLASDPVSCTPSCKGKKCGDDGCGDACGKCAPGRVCNQGRCADAR